MAGAPQASRIVNSWLINLKLCLNRLFFKDFGLQLQFLGKTRGTKASFRFIFGDGQEIGEVGAPTAFFRFTRNRRVAS